MAFYPIWKTPVLHIDNRISWFGVFQVEFTFVDNSIQWQPKLDVNLLSMWVVTFWIKLHKSDSVDVAYTALGYMFYRL